MIRHLLYNRTAARPCKLISRDGRPYLERYFLGKRGERLFYLHRFVSGDGDAEVHDHPREAVGIVLVGGYVEERMVTLSPNHGWTSRERRIFPGRPNRIRAGDFHRIKWTVPDTWSLFVFGPPLLTADQQFKGWGFLRHLPGRWVQFTPGGKQFWQNGSVTYHQPFEMTHDTPWWEDAPLGRDAGREPMGGCG